MATQAWDTAQALRYKAGSLDHFLYVDGKTSPKVAQKKEPSHEECLEFLEELRLFLWDESKDLHDGIRNGY